MADVFLSYARADLEIAQRVVGYLEAVGYSVFWDTRLQAGEYFDEKIEAELEACACVVVLWTERSVKRRWVRVEAREAVEREILVPVSVQGARPPLEFRGIQTLAMDEASEVVLEALRGAVSRHVAPGSGAPSSAGWTFDEAADGLGRYADVRIGDVGFRMRWIEAGTFEMGSGPEDREAFDRERPQHVVRLSEGFWIAEAPCEQRLWEAVMGSNPSKFKEGRRPVERVSWDAVQAFLAATPAALGLRLPTEAEWEYACRAGSTAPRYGGLDAVAWFRDNAGGETHAVKQKQPNAWGLYDTLGSVHEWCADGADEVRGDPYPAEPTADPAAPSGERPSRVVRGGSWASDARDVRAASRYADPRGLSYDNVGFRLARGRAPSSLGGAG